MNIYTQNTSIQMNLEDLIKLFVLLKAGPDQYDLTMTKELIDQVCSFIDSFYRRTDGKPEDLKEYQLELFDKKHELIRHAFKVIEMESTIGTYNSQSIASIWEDFTFVSHWEKNETNSNNERITWKGLEIAAPIKEALASILLAKAVPVLDEQPKDDNILRILSGIHYRLNPNLGIAKDVLQIILEHDKEHEYVNKHW